MFEPSERVLQRLPTTVVLQKQALGSTRVRRLRHARNRDMQTRRGTRVCCWGGVGWGSGWVGECLPALSLVDSFFLYLPRLWGAL